MCIERLIKLVFLLHGSATSLLGVLVGFFSLFYPSPPTHSQGPTPQVWKGLPRGAEQLLAGESPGKSRSSREEGKPAIVFLRAQEYFYFRS